MNTTHDDETEDTYFMAAETALQRYVVDPLQLNFISHNAGRVYRASKQDSGQSYLLKLHIRVGEGGNASPERLELGMQWLAGIARETTLVVQTPIASCDDSFVSIVEFEGKSICCTLQQWLDGSPPNGPLTNQQLWQIGSMMAQLHRYSRNSSIDAVIDALDAMRHDAIRYDSATINERLQVLRAALDFELFSSRADAIARNAMDQVQATMARLGTSSDVWGPIHGDLNYDNLIISGNTVNPIDFSGLRVAHYLYDLGVTLYHTFHQGEAARMAFLDGYQEVETLPAQHLTYLEAFVTYAALDSLAWNATLPEQVQSPLFQKNMRQFVFTFCQSLADNIAFLS